MNITVCVITADRPQRLGHVIRCFEKQTYRDRNLVALDDSGQVSPDRGDRWRIYAVDRPYGTRAAKRNACARLAPAGTEAVVMWDDDQLYLPWGLEATAAALQTAQWSRPGLACLLTETGKFQAIRTHSYGRTDNAYQCTWGLRAEAFWRVGGYDEHRSRGEDAALAMKLVFADVPEADPTLLGWPPWCICGPAGLLDTGPTPGGVDSQNEFGKHVRVADPPAVNLDRPSFLPGVAPRPFQHNWYDALRQPSIEEP